MVPDAGPLRLIPDLGLPASGAGANVLRIAGGNGIKLAKSAIASNEVRNDGMSTRGRHGTQQVSAAYHAEASLGALDPIIEAIMRGAWDTTAFSKTQADFMSLTTAVDGINFTSGNPITMGFRVGDVFRATGLPDAANNNRNLRIAALSSTKITTAEQLTANATPDTSCALTRPGKRLIDPATLLKSYFTLEEYEGDIDQSTVVQDFVWGRHQVLDVLGKQPLDGRPDRHPRHVCRLGENHAQQWDGALYDECLARDVAGEQGLPIH